LQFALRVEWLAFGIDQIAFETADHHLTQLLFIGQDVSAKRWSSSNSSSEVNDSV
jgi:hypothetical protein